MQEIHFRTIDDFLDHLPAHERDIVDYLRDLILECMPDCTEKLAYNVPYYYLKARVCFIWPASVPWGSVRLSGVQLGFCQGHRLRDETHYLERGRGKQVYTKTFSSPGQVDREVVRSFIFEANEVDAGRI
jgi:hypothetical protein